MGKKKNKETNLIENLGIICKAKAKSTGNRCTRKCTPGFNVCYFHGANPGSNPGGHKGNQFAVKTGEYQTIFFEALSDIEKGLWNQVETDKKNSLVESLKLTTIREYRMLQKLKELNEEYNKNPSHYRFLLDNIQSFEEALTRVQAQKTRIIDKLIKVDAVDKFTNDSTDILTKYLASLENMGKDIDDEDDL